MDVWTRRRFLLASGAMGAAALAAGAGGYGIATLLRTAGKMPLFERGGKRILVVVTLYGGNDGLNTVIPYVDSAYYSARPDLAYDPEKVLRLDDALGLNPMMPGLKRIWDQRRLAVVLGVGYPKPDRSHFRSMDIWQSASPAHPAMTGWVGRWLDGTKAGVEAAVSFESVLPPLLVGSTRVGACVSYQGLSLPSWVDADTIAALGRSEPDEPPMQARAAEAYADLLSMNRVLQETKSGEEGATDAGTSSSDNPLALQLALVAKCVEAGVPTRVYSVSLDGFDTHAMERAGHERLLKQLDEALTGFVDRLSRTEAGRQVTVVVYSEFGRRVRANASDGTDHGTAGPMFVLGAPVVGGFYGEQPSLTDLDDGDLKATMDFRDVLGTLLASVLQAEPERYLDGYQANLLPFLNTE